MAKEKNKIEEKNEDYLYEVLAFGLMLFSFVTLGTLGKFGELLSLGIKVVFGDFSFLILLIMFFLGIRLLIKRKLPDYHSLVFIGFWVLYSGIMMLSHLAIYDSLKMKNTEVISQTFTLYKNYFSSFDESYITGGGFIGALFFQVIILLFGKIGVILISISLIILGISFCFNTSLIDFLLNGKKVSGIFKRIFFTVKGYFSKVDYSKRKKTPIGSAAKINIGLLSDIDISSNKMLQEEINKEVEENFKNYIKQNNLFCIYNKHVSSYNSTSYLLDIISDQSYKQTIEKINYFFDNKCFILRANNAISIEVYNKFKELLTLRRLLSIKDCKNLIIGMDNNNEVMEFDFDYFHQLVLCGDYNVGIRNTIRSLMFSLFLANQSALTVELLDSKGEFSELLDICENINYYVSDGEGMTLLDKLAIEYERRKELFNFLNVDNVWDANNEIKSLHPKINLVKPIYVIINSNLAKNKLDIENKLNYLLKFSYKMGIYFILVARNKDDYNRLLINNCAYMMFNTIDIEFSLRVMNNDLGCMLQKKGDFLFLFQNKIHHGQTPYLSMTDYNRFIKKIIS